jgi:hypothetical protein
LINSESANIVQKNATAIGILARMEQNPGIICTFAREKKNGVKFGIFHENPTFALPN